MIHGRGVDNNVVTGCMGPIFKGRSGWKRIYFDLPGMGRMRASDRLKNSDDMHGIVIWFCKEVIPDRNFSIAGESYGGYLARGLVNDVPDYLDGVLIFCPTSSPTGRSVICRNVGHSLAMSNF